MTYLWRAAKNNKKLATSLGIGLALVLGWMSYQTYGSFTKPDPQVFMLPFAWQPEKQPAPVTNTGVDANGLTLDQWIAKGQEARKYQPVLKRTFKPGDTMWTLRFDCFVNKVSDGKISRAFLGGDGNTADSRSMYMLPTLEIPTRTNGTAGDGCAVKNHRTLIPADLLPGTWQYQVAVNFWVSQERPSVRVVLTPVTIDVKP